MSIGLVALASDGVLEMMSDEFPDKYKVILIVYCSRNTCITYEMHFLF